MDRLTAAHQQARRTKRDRTGLLHLALALRDEDPEGFADVYGAEAGDRLEHAAWRIEVPRADVGAFLERYGPDAPPTTVLIGLRDLIWEAIGERRPRAFIAPEHLALADVVDDTVEIIGRSALVDDLLVHLGRRNPRPVLLRGAPGIGRTSVLHALAARVFDVAYDGPLAGATVLRVAAERLHPGSAAADLTAVVQAARRAAHPVIVAVDDLEVAAGLDGADRLDPSLLRALRAEIGRGGVPVLLLLDSEYAARLSVYAPELTDELVEIEVPALAPAQVAAIATTQGRSLATHHGASCSTEAIVAACAPPRRTERRSHPGLAIDRLDEAMTTARVAERRRVEVGDVPGPTATDLASVDREALARAMRADVLHQDAAIGRVLERLAVTRRQFDLQPHRPDGVFVFAGPSGVGKTSLAQALARHLYGDEQALIRLDMTEYSDAWSVSRLIGPQPGYVGSREPETWLTTRIRRRPRTVLLLDEIDKASLEVCDVLLQVFDAGRLTDARGVTADFSQTIICMTSNQGAHRHAGPIGYAIGQPDKVQREQVAEQLGMRVELVGRIDEVIDFERLEPDAVREIAERRCGQLTDRFRAKGYDLTIEDAVIDLVAEEGYDPSSGCRDLNRAIDHLLALPLTEARPGRHHAVVVEGAVRWQPADQRADQPDVGQ